MTEYWENVLKHSMLISHAGIQIWIGCFRVSKSFHFQNEVMCTTFLLKMCFICMRVKNHFHVNGFALSLALKQRLEATWNTRYRNDKQMYFSKKSIHLIESKGYTWPALTVTLYFVIDTRVTGWKVSFSVDKTIFILRFLITRIVGLIPLWAKSDPHLLKITA